MRKWFPGYCSECGREDGYWEDIAEGPITLEQHEEREKSRAFWSALYGPLIKQQLQESVVFNKISDPGFPVKISSAQITVSKQLLEGWEPDED